MNRTTTSLSMITALTLLAGSAGADSGPGPDSAPEPGPVVKPDGPTVRQMHIDLFLRAWENGLKIADADRSGEIDGADVEAFFRALAADMNGDGRLDAADIPAMFEAWAQGIDAGDVNLDGGVDGGDLEAFFVALSEYTLPSATDLAEAILTPEADARDPNGGGSEQIGPAELTE